jgi:hypothetical protein
MQPNMGTIDRSTRVVLALVAAALIVSGQVSGLVAIILGVLAAVFVLTSVIGFCPLYLPFGIRTCPQTKRWCAFSAEIRDWRLAYEISNLQSPIST